MSAPNPIRNRRFLDLLTRLFDLQEQPMGFGPASASLALETEDAQELDLLRGIRRFGISVGPAAVAGQFTEFLFDNPVNSGTIIRFEDIAVNSAAADNFKLQLNSGVSTATFTDQGPAGVLDSRIRIPAGYQIGVGRLWAKTTAASVGGNRWAVIRIAAAQVDQDIHVSRQQAKCVLDPGQQLVITGATVNTLNRLSLIYTERAMTPQERFPNGL